MRSIHTEPGSYGGSVRTDLASDGSGALALYSTTREAPELWRLGPGLERRRRVSSLNPEFDPASLGEDRLVRWTTGDGEMLEGTLLLPPGFRDGEAVPLIVQVYGGIPEPPHWTASIGIASSSPRTAMRSWSRRYPSGRGPPWPTMPARSCPASSG